MFAFLKKGLTKSGSRKTAKDRLMAVVSRDRANVSAEFLLRLTTELLDTAAKYIVPDYDAVSIRIERRGTGACLCATLPVVSYVDPLRQGE